MSREVCYNPKIEKEVMEKQINFGDNIFFLTLILKGLSSGVRLSLDNDLFLDKLVEDIFFLEGSIEKVFELIKQRVLLIDRLGHLKNLETLSSDFAALLEEITLGNIPVAEHLAAFSDRFNSIKDNQHKLASEIRGIIHDTDQSETIEEDMVSQEEFEFLLAEENEENND
ncbi:MAG TPA: hypothetical protein ENI06_06645 [Spirochaetales bacterium]|nr:hypothetical protein [Spirochaetales bacterium]